MLDCWSVSVAAPELVWKSGKIIKLYLCIGREIIIPTQVQKGFLCAHSRFRSVDYYGNHVVSFPRYLFFHASRQASSVLSFYNCTRERQLGVVFNSCIKFHCQSESFSWCLRALVARWVNNCIPLPWGWKFIPFHWIIKCLKALAVKVWWKSINSWWDSCCIILRLMPPRYPPPASAFLTHWTPRARKLRRDRNEIIYHNGKWALSHCFGRGALAKWFSILMLPDAIFQ